MMPINVNEVIAVVAQVARKGPQESKDISAESRLQSLGLSSSLGLSLLRSALERRFKKKLGALSWQMTVAQLCDLLLGNENSLPPAPAPAASAPAAREPKNEPAPSGAAFDFAGIGMGVDIEDVAGLPLVANFREDDFYRRHFSEEEISYAVLRPDPRVHLCGLFCAKEALKKSEPELLDLPMAEIFVSHIEGKPFIRTLHEHLNARFAFKVSISHTNTSAIATVLTQRRP